MKYIKILYIFFTITTIISLNACNKVEENMKKIKVDLTFYTDSRAIESMNDIIPGEGIKTVRVIVAQNNRVVKNDYFYDISANATAGIRTFTLFDLPIGNLDFYLIANEESCPNLSVWLTENFKQNEIGDFMALSNHILSNTVTSPLIMSAKYLNVLINESTSYLEFSLIRSIAKITLTLTNLGTQPLNLSEIRLGEFIPNRGYLFPQNEFVIPTLNRYSDLIITNHIRLVPNESKLCFTHYLYENQCPLSNYTLSIVANNHPYPPIVLPISSVLIAKIMRNTHLNIQATVTPTAIVITNYEVNSWIDQNVNLPPFN